MAARDSMGTALSSTMGKMEQGLGPETLVDYTE